MVLIGIYFDTVGWTSGRVFGL